MYSLIILHWYWFRSKIERHQGSLTGGKRESWSGKPGEALNSFYWQLLQEQAGIWWSASDVTSDPTSAVRKHVCSTFWSSFKKPLRTSPRYKSNYDTASQKRSPFSDRERKVQLCFYSGRIIQWTIHNILWLLNVLESIVQSGINYRENLETLFSTRLTYCALTKLLSYTSLSIIGSVLIEHSNLNTFSL